MWTKIVCGLGLLSTIILLGGISGDIRGWHAAMTWLSLRAPARCDFSGECGQGILVLMGCVLLGIGFNYSKTAPALAQPLFGKKSWLKRICQRLDRGHAPRWVMPRGYTSMKEAAQAFNDAARAGIIVGAKASERLSGWSNNGPAKGPPEDVLHWWAAHISKELAVYGRRPPSELLEEIPPRHVKEFVFTSDAMSIKDPMSDSFYVDLAVKTGALEELFGVEAEFYD